MTNEYSDYYELSYRERWELKRAEMIAKRKKRLATVLEYIICSLAFLLFIILLLEFGKGDGYYRYKDGNADGTGINYEYVEPE